MSASDREQRCLHERTRQDGPWDRAPCMHAAGARMREWGCSWDEAYNATWETCLCVTDWCLDCTKARLCGVRGEWQETIPCSQEGLEELKRYSGRHLVRPARARTAVTCSH